MERKKFAIEGLLTIIATLFLGAIGVTSASLVAKLVVFTIMTILILYISRLEILNPIFWFTTIMFLYGIPNSMVRIIFYGISRDSSLTDIDLSMIAMLSFFIAFYICSFLFKNKPLENVFSRIVISKATIDVSFTIVVILNILFLFYLNIFNIDSKLELMNTGIIYSIYTNLNIFYYFLIGFYFSYRLKLNKKFLVKFSLIMVLNFFVYYNTGERDVIIFPAITMFFLLSAKYFKHIKVMFFIPTLAVGVISLPLLLNLGVRNTGGGDFLNFDNFFYRIFSSELISASKNIGLVVQDSTFVPLGLIIPFSIFVNSFIDIPLFPSILNFHGVSWFTERYYSNLPEGAGAGFSLIVEGYIFAGISGVVIWFLFIAILLLIMFRATYNNTTMLCIYTVMVPIIMYSIRGSLETIFIYLVRIIIICFILFTIDQIFFKKTNKNKV
ncbi:O-antigen polymerase [Indiicoccus explosivorum]|uniref:O-antigen polymerase n=1 Tax=Indiicoccus explosivorum TaxID=1917864 RepID=UPI000B44C3BD|nr:O-antigen polymerase [Indiicoccus explosivorum]